MKDYLVDAIRKLKPNSEFSFTDQDYSTIKWNVLEGTAPTQTEINSSIEQVKAEEIAATSKAAADKAALLAKLGLTADEFKTLLGGN